MEKIIENATCYELKSGAKIERQEHCDICWENGGYIAGLAQVYEDELFFYPFDKKAFSFVDDIVRYSYDYGRTWEVV